MLQKLSKVFLALTLILSLLFGQGSVVKATSQTDIDLIKERLKEYFLKLDTIDDGSKVEACFVSKAEDYLKLINEGGAFKDVDYDAHNNAANGAAWSPYLALDRLQAIAIAYHKEGNALYHNKAARDGIDKAIKYWGKVSPTNDNWWEREVGIQLRFSRIALFMDGIISQEAQDIMLTKLLERKPEKQGTGQNNLWFDQNYIYHALLTNDTAQLKDMITNYLNYCLVTQKDDNTQEAVQVDNSFYMHGKQFYSNGYGMSMFRDMSFWIYMLRGTEFAVSPEVVQRMADYMLEGTRWTIRRDIQELYLGYRPYKYDVNYKNYAEEYIEPLKRMIEVDKEHAADYQNVLNNILGTSQSNGRNGNYYMWRSGYASHMRNNYGVNIKMDSSELKGGEWRGSWPNGVNKGQLIYYTSAASSTIVVDGDEYTSVFPVFDWKHTPGTTAPNALSGRYTFENSELFNIGVSDGNYGATAYKFGKMSTKGQKGYFFFDDEFVALGTNISSTNGNKIHTTLNQSKASDVKVDGQVVSEGTDAKKYSAKSIYNNKVGYVFLENTDVYISNKAQKDMPSLWPENMKKDASSVFTAYLDHGTKPKDASYSYIVVPGKTEAQVSEYSKNIPITVVANNKDVQAVRHDGLKQTQINFYSAGELEYKPGYKVSVNQPCSMIIDESGSETKITVAMREQDAGKELVVQMNHASQTTKTDFIIQGIPYAGQSLTAKEGQSFKYDASSYTEGHTPGLAHDSDKETYWESKTNGTEWLSTYVNSNTKIKNMTITWGDNYATHYKVEASKDGVNYDRVAEITNGDGGEDIVKVNSVYQYVKIIATQSSGATYQIKEIELEEYQNLSRKRPVTVSSVSKEAPTFVGNLAVDGSYASRWASLRKSDDNWIVIDLQKYAKIENVDIYWEASCSDNYDILVSQDGQRWTTVKSGLKAGTQKNPIDTVELNDVGGRYIKLHSKKSRSYQYGINIYEIDVFGNYAEEPPLEVAYQQNTFASAINTSHIPNYATDGDTATYWQSESAGNQWIYFELKNTYQLYDCRIKWGDTYATSYDIEVSDDAKTWKTVKKVSNGTGGDVTFNDFLNVRGKYLRLNLKASSGSDYKIKEILTHGDLISKDESVNIALKKTYKASSEYNAYTAAGLAFDGSFKNNGGNDQSRWVSKRNSDNEFIEVDLGDFYNLSGLKLYWEGAGASQYKILVSRDGKNYTEAYVENNGQPGILDLQLEKTIVARYVKMQGVKCASQYGYSLWEFEVYGNDYNGENGLVNVAAFQPAASSTIDNKSIPSRAVDTDKTSSFKSLSEKNPWLNVFLRDIYTISSSKIIFNTHDAESYAIESSLDGENWTIRKTIKVEDKMSPYYFEFDETFDTRYLRIRVLDDSKRILEIKDFAVYGKLSKKIEDENIAAYKVSAASSEYDNGKGFTHESKYAFDESIENKGDSYQSRWVSNRESKDEWIYVNLGDYYELTSIILNWEAHATEYKIQVSDDLQTWTDISHITNGVAGVKELVYENCPQAKYVRMQGIEYATKYGYSLWEFEVYGLSIRSQLKQAYDRNCNIDTSIYTPNSVAIYKDALDNAIKIYQTDESTGNEMTSAIKQINNAISGLTRKADKRQLSIEIAVAERTLFEYYTLESAKVYKDAIEKAKTIFNDDNATQMTVESMVSLLKTAQNQLVKKADKKGLEKAIQETKAIDTKLYTDETVEVLTTVLKEAEEIYKDETATQETVDAIVKKLQEAVEKLEEKEVDIVVTPDKPNENKPGEPEQNNNQPTTEEKVETSDNTQYQMYIGLLCISMCVMALLINKKKKNQVK